MMNKLEEIEKSIEGCKSPLMLAQLNRKFIKEISLKDGKKDEVTDDILYSLLKLANCISGPSISIQWFYYSV